MPGAIQKLDDDSEVDDPPSSDQSAVIYRIWEVLNVSAMFTAILVLLVQRTIGAFSGRWERNTVHRLCTLSSLGALILMLFSGFALYIGGIVDEDKSYPEGPSW
ncbi:hypothetical protein L1887_39447 [Cichorium endivia]|nr:hypothetical protein L1887_39447 [Cichorium endivia]